MPINHVDSDMGIMVFFSRKKLKNFKKKNKLFKNVQENEFMEYIIVLCTAPKSELAKEIVESKLAACVNISETSSIYTWKDKVEESREYLFTIKTLESKYKDLEDLIKKKHPYECPEIIKLSIDGYEKYLNWIKDSLL